MARAHNEDAYFIDGDQSLFVVADGMGGHSHGEVASKIAVDTIGRMLATPEVAPPAEAAASLLRPHSRRLKVAIEHAHAAMLEAIRADLSLQGMGTTVAGIIVDDGVAAVAHVGDSRVYRLRDGVFEQLTADHTWVNEQVMAGYLSEEQARTHPLRNVVTRALGGEADVVVDVREIEIRPGDLFVVCSDGLTAMLNDAEIGEHVAGGGSLEDRCRRLVDDANSRGGVDNITVILAYVEAGAAG
jgi:protein phosphatase